jgi:hypothetical protein
MGGVKSKLSFPMTNQEHVSASMHHRVLCALLYLYRHVLGIDFPWLDQLHRLTKPFAG